MKKTKTQLLVFAFLAILLVFYLFTRLSNLTLLPIFFDEANYIFWAKRIEEGNAGWFLPLTYGKPPLPIWIITFFLKIFPADSYLLAGRLPTVIFGFVTMSGIYKLGGAAFGRKVGLASAFLYLLTPFSLFYDRMALFDSMLSAMLIWSVYFMFRRKAILWGALLGGALLTKASALSYEILMPAAFLVLNGARRFWLILIAFLASQVITNLQAISTGYPDYLKKSLDYTSSGQSFFSNLLLSWEWLSAYLTPPILVFALLALCLSLYLKPRVGIAFVILGIAPILGFAFLGRIFFPRYLLFTLPYFLISLAYLLSLFVRKSRLVTFLILPLILLPAIKFDHFLLTNPAKAFLPEIDRWQYVSGYPSGYGLQPVFSFIKEESRTQKIHLIVQGSFSHYPNAFFLEFWENPNVWVEERWPLETTASQEFTPSNKVRPHEFDRTYYIVRNDERAGLRNVVEKYELKEILRGQKPGGHDSVFVTTQ